MWIIYWTGIIDYTIWWCSYPVVCLINMKSNFCYSSIFMFVKEVLGTCISSMGLMQMTIPHSSGCNMFSIKKSLYQRDKWWLPLSNLHQRKKQLHNHDIVSSTLLNHHHCDLQCSGICCHCLHWKLLNSLGVLYKAIAVQPQRYLALLVLIHMKNLVKNQYMYNRDSLAFISYTSDKLFWHYQIHIFAFCARCIYSSCNCDWMLIWFKILVVQPAPYCALSAAATDQCWKDPDCILLKYFPPSILHRIAIKFSEMLVVLLLTSWEALDTSLSTHDSISLIKSGGKLSKGSESVWESEQILQNIM